MLLKIVLSWDKILLFASVVVLLTTLLKNVFGVNVIGKKIYELLWKWIMRSSIHRREMDFKMNTLLGSVAEIKHQVTFNGGSSLKDIVASHTSMLSEMNTKLTFNQLRLDVNDMCSDRMTFKVDKHGACTFINDAFLKCFDYSEKDVLGFAFENLVHDEDVKEMRDKWARCIEKKTKFIDEQRIFTKDAKALNCLVRAIPLIEGDELHGFYGTIDIINDN